MKVQFTLTQEESQSMGSGAVPYAVQLRQKLNNKGFKFKDDGRLESIVNENPKPLGTLTVWKSIENGDVHYVQVY